MPHASDLGGPSVVVAGLKAAAYAAIPSGVVLILAAIAEGSVLATVALVTPAAVGVAAALAARRSRGRPRR